MHRPIHPAELLARCVAAYAVARRDVLGSSRDPQVTEARQLLMLLLHEQCGWPVCVIARKLRRHHSTVCHGIKRARERTATPGGALLYTQITQMAVGREESLPAPEPAPQEEKEVAAACTQQAV